MTQDERWQANYDEVMEFIENNRRNPSRHRIEEHDMLNWYKANRKVMNAGKMKAERVEKFKILLEMTEQYKRKNQYQYIVAKISQHTEQDRQSMAEPSSTVNKGE